MRCVLLPFPRGCGRLLREVSQVEAVRVGGMANLATEEESRLAELLK